jgi:hypothetical protein
VRRKAWAHCCSWRLEKRRKLQAIPRPFLAVGACFISVHLFYINLQKGHQRTNTPQVFLIAIVVQQRQDILRPRRWQPSEVHTLPNDATAKERRKADNRLYQQRHRDQQKTVLAELKHQVAESKNVPAGPQPPLPSAEQLSDEWDTSIPALPLTQVLTYPVDPPGGFVVGTWSEPGETSPPPGAEHCNSNTRPTADWPHASDHVSGWANADFQVPTIGDHSYTQDPFVPEPYPVAPPALDNVFAQTPIKPPSAIAHTAPWSSTLAPFEAAPIPCSSPPLSRPSAAFAV